ncbi:hypothetical protein [Mucilaginibacter myungsuensis]|uniref:Uncharacterized protein n=1 Tax=Mucilaginibacter myungsuensis TaxID=649104 RepID=A0A929PYV4_9SPHI|nr:hypothetical protein [Mucilaginibacter myungsuensis]MBE9663845.1 hypothetical protein [Mucilaginibacter myungsuensis]MDN3598440.1 hypothetical protein [Mucilaginibacter myungsuensis]
MFYILTIIASALFLAHVILLVLSFKGSALEKTRYFYSHLTLWLTGIVVFALAGLYQGTGRSGVLDNFDSLQKQVYILVFTFALSLVAHLLVTYVVLPLVGRKG